MAAPGATRTNNGTSFHLRWKESVLNHQNLLDHQNIMNIIVVSYSENSCYVKGMRVLFMHQKYTKAFYSSTYLLFVVALKIAGFLKSFSSLFDILLDNVIADIVNLYLIFVSFSHFQPMFYFPWKHKTSGFLVFSRGI